ncbi:MAG: DNA recombination protein RmuC [Clostridia bacterium]|nr:DNA recombination protein RmuC [Clostridia bacterium]
MITILLIISCVLSFSSLIACIIIGKKKTGSSKALGDELSKQNTTNINTILASIKQSEIGMQNQLNNISILQRNESALTQQKVDELTSRNEVRIEKLTNDVNNSMRLIREENEKQLEQMRQTVDEKLNNSLTTRLNESFSKIRASLDNVGIGLGEMKSLATGVGDLKRMLSNVKARGVWGEVSLASLLEQALTTEQFASQVSVKPNSSERVDFAVYLPGKDDQNIILPIDSKFPIEDYYRLVDASELANIEETEKAQKALFTRVKNEAKKIKEKYVNPPVTTDFAVMFLPLEGLYAEIVRNNELMDTLQNEYKILVCGPTTLMALLNSLQMGFKTLYIEKRSSEIWSMLAVFKQEFEKFVMLLGKTQKKLDEVGDNIELATKSSRKISKQLNQVSSLPDNTPLSIPDSDDFDN